MTIPRHEKSTIIMKSMGTTKSGLQLIEGPLWDLDSLERRSRRYPADVVEAAIEAAQDMVGKRSMLGRFGPGPIPALSYVALVVDRLWISDGVPMVRAAILDTVMGCKLSALVSEHLERVGFAAMGRGRVTKDIYGDEVISEYVLERVDAFDRKEAKN